MDERELQNYQPMRRSLLQVGLMVGRNLPLLETELAQLRRTFNGFESEGVLVILVWGKGKVGSEFGGWCRVNTGVELGQYECTE